MKRESKRRRGGGGGSTSGKRTIAESRRDAGKIFSPKKAKLKQDILRNRRESVREAAYDELCEEEECRDLARKFALESAKKTGDAIGEVLDRYEAIVIEFIRARSGGALIHEYAADPMKLEKLGQFLYAATKATAGYEVWPELGRMQERKALFRVLAPEYARDRNTLMKFLRSVFVRHRKIGGERSAWREKLCTHQLAAEYEPKQIAIELERSGVVANTKTEQEFKGLRARVRQTLQARKRHG